MLLNSVIDYNINRENTLLARYSTRKLCISPIAIFEYTSYKFDDLIFQRGISPQIVHLVI